MNTRERFLLRWHERKLGGPGRQQQMLGMLSFPRGSDDELLRETGRLLQQGYLVTITPPAWSGKP